MSTKFSLTQISILYCFIGLFVAGAESIKVTHGENELESGEFLGLDSGIYIYRGYTGEGYEGTSIWKFSKHDHLLQTEVTIIPRINKLGTKEFPESHLFGYRERDDHGNQVMYKVYETRFLGQLAIDEVKNAEDVSKFVKEIGRELLDVLTDLHKNRKHSHGYIKDISIILTEDGASLINFHTALKFKTGLPIAQIKTDLTQLGEALKALAGIRKVTIGAIDTYLQKVSVMEISTEKHYEELKTILE